VICTARAGPDPGRYPVRLGNPSRINRLERLARFLIEHARESSVDIQEIRKIEAYMRRLFGNARLRVVPRPKKDDSAEIYIGEEFIGVLFVDDEDNERSYNFQMAILGTDLD
jgi:hypothetical protein